MPRALKHIQHNKERQLIAILAGVLFAVVILYFYFVQSTVQAVVVRKNTELDMSNMSARISEMEFAYIDLKNSVDLDQAYASGFTEATRVLYVSRDVLTPALSLNTNDR